ncbi:hypothetical protein DQ238_15470 [Geodermatophilus sp. TF02-6]|nr:hypothetical protein DQ238_15470 [Geodermatophilus sp. TF02-6]
MEVGERGADHRTAAQRVRARTVGGQVAGSGAPTGPASHSRAARTSVRGSSADSRTAVTASSPPAGSARTEGLRSGRCRLVGVVE